VERVAPPCDVAGVGRTAPPATPLKEGVAPPCAATGVGRTAPPATPLKEGVAPSCTAAGVWRAAAAAAAGGGSAAGVRVRRRQRGEGAPPSEWGGTPPCMARRALSEAAGEGGSEGMRNPNLCLYTGRSYRASSGLRNCIWMG